MRAPRVICAMDALSRSEPICANAARLRYCARSRRKLPATCFMALICALLPPRLTEIPTLIAGRPLTLNKSDWSEIWPTVAGFVQRQCAAGDQRGNFGEPRRQQRADQGHEAGSR